MGILAIRVNLVWSFKNGSEKKGEKERYGVFSHVLAQRVREKTPDPFFGSK